jgi:hypothetical protein
MSLLVLLHGEEVTLRSLKELNTVWRELSRLDFPPILLERPHKLKRHIIWVNYLTSSLVVMMVFTLTVIIALSF